MLGLALGEWLVLLAVVVVPLLGGAALGVALVRAARRRAAALDAGSPPRRLSRPARPTPNGRRSSTD